MGVKLRTIKRKGGRQSYYLDIYTTGGRKTESLKIYIEKNDSASIKKEKKRIAESIRAKYEIELLYGTYNFESKLNRKVDFIQYYDEFLKAYTGKDERIVKYSLEKFKDYLKVDSINASKLDHSLCKGFADYLKSKECGLTGETPSNYWTKFKKVIKALIKDGVLTQNPTDEIVVKKDSSGLKKQILTQEELQSLIDTECGRDDVKRAFLFACFTGVGMAEIRKLRWVDLSNNKLTYKRAKNENQVIIDLHNLGRDAAGEKGDPNDLVFKGMPSDTTVRKHLRKLVRDAKVDKSISFYCGRHTFAILLLSNGASLLTVARCMGHTSTKHTVKYLNYVDELKEKAIMSLPDLKL